MHVHTRVLPTLEKASNISIAFDEIQEMNAQEIAGYCATAFQRNTSLRSAVHESQLRSVIQHSIDRMKTCLTSVEALRADRSDFAEIYVQAEG